MSDSVDDTPCISHLSTGQIVGLSFIAESGVISTIAVLIFLALVVRNVIRDRRHPGPNGPQPLIRTHIDGYMLSLMMADLLQGFGAVMTAKWAKNGTVTCSAYCTAQGAIQQLGETGVAMSTLAITLHTFATVFFRWQPSRHPWVWMVVVAFIWLFLLLFVVIGYAVNKGDELQPGGEPYFGPTPYWCWIQESHMPERIAGEYFWLWAAAVVNIILYPFLFFTLRGNIQVDPTNWRRIRINRRRNEDMFGRPALTASMNDAESMKIQKAKNREAMKMFWYPVSYTFLVLPLSINRWSTFEDNSPPEDVKDMNILPTAIVLFIFGLSGVVNVLLFMLTRPNILLFHRKRRQHSSSVAQYSSGIEFQPQPGKAYARPTANGMVMRKVPYASGSPNASPQFQLHTPGHPDNVWIYGDEGDDYSTFGRDRPSADGAYVVYPPPPQSPPPQPHSKHTGLEQDVVEYAHAAKPQQLLPPLHSPTGGTFLSDDEGRSGYGSEDEKLNRDEESRGFPRSITPLRAEQDLMQKRASSSSGPSTSSALSPFKADPSQLNSLQHFVPLTTNMALQRPGTAPAGSSDAPGSPLNTFNRTRVLHSSPLPAHGGPERSHALPVMLPSSEEPAIPPPPRSEPPPSPTQARVEAWTTTVQRQDGKPF